jgi:hypothetical protein
MRTPLCRRRTHLFLAVTTAAATLAYAHHAGPQPHPMASMGTVESQTKSMRNYDAPQRLKLYSAEPSIGS